MEVKLLDFGQLLSTAGGAESAPADASLNILGVTDTPGFDNVLAVQLGALAKSFISSGKGLEEYEDAIHSFLEESGIIAPLPAEIYRQFPDDDSIGPLIHPQPPNENSAESLIFPANFSVTQTENPSESLDPPTTPRPLADYKLQLPLESNSNLEKPLTGNFSVVKDEIESIPGKFQDAVIESAGLNREHIPGNTPLPENKIHVTSLSKPFGQANWNQEFGDRIIWLINKSHSSAELRLTPPNLGTIEVKINILQEQANITFSSQNAQVREVLESTIPRLREMLGAQQIQLNDVFVDQHSFSSQSGANPNRQFSGEKFSDSPTENLIENSDTGDDVHEQGILTSESVLSLYV